MAIRRNNFDGGTNGTGLTVGNTGGDSGDAFTAVEVAALFSNAQAHSGALSVVAPTGTESGLGRWSVPDSARQIALVSYVYMTDAQVADADIMRVEVSGAASDALRVQIMSTSRLRLRLPHAATNVWTATNQLPLNQWIRVECIIDIGTTDSNGQAHLAYYADENPTAIDESTLLTGLDLAGDGGTLANVRFLKGGANAIVGNIYFDDIGYNSGSDYAGFIGPNIIDPDPPIIAISNGGTYQLLDATASTAGDDGDLTFEIDPDDDVIDLGDGRFFVPNATESYEITVTESPSELDDADTIGVTELTGAAPEWPKRPDWDGTPTDDWLP